MNYIVNNKETEDRIKARLSNFTPWQNSYEENIWTDIVTKEIILGERIKSIRYNRTHPPMFDNYLDNSMFCLRCPSCFQEWIDIAERFIDIGA